MSLSMVSRPHLFTRWLNRRPKPPEADPRELEARDARDAELQEKLAEARRKIIEAETVILLARREVAR